MNPKLFSVALCTVFFASLVRCSPVETKNETETIKVVTTNTTAAAVTPIIPSTKVPADVKPENKTIDAKNDTVHPKSNKTAEPANNTESLPVHTNPIVPPISTTNTTIPHNINQTNATTTPAVPTTMKTAAPTEVTTPKPPTTVTTTETTTHTVTVLPTFKVQEKDGGFDGPSFIGGIVLTLGLTGIGFVAYKFCKARTDRNYRNL